MILDPVDILQKLVAIPSVSPMRPDLPEEIVGEGRLTDFLEKTFTQIGLAVWRQPVLPGRENLLARLDGDVSPAEGGRVVLFDAHQDTVPVDGMTIEPFRPEQRDGRIYGRGACDVKGGMAAILAAVARLAHERPRPLPTIIVSCSADEENGFRGATRLAEQWGGVETSLVCPQPHAAIVLEPTGLNVVVIHKGVIRWKCHVHGRAAHSSCPQLGQNAIYRMARVVTSIEQYAALLAAGPAHPHCGPSTVSVGIIQGGSNVNTVPDRCTIEIDLRTLPGEELTVARQRLLDHVAAGQDFEVDNEPPYLQGPSLSDRQNGRLAEQLSAVTREVAGSCRLTGMSGCTNAPFFAAASIPTVIFGPGFLEQAHTADEWIPVDQLLQATEIIYQFCREFAANPTP
jgi:acetylornithine deacetylase